METKIIKIPEELHHQLRIFVAEQKLRTFGEAIKKLLEDKKCNKK